MRQAEEKKKKVGNIMSERVKNCDGHKSVFKQNVVNQVIWIQVLRHSQHSVNEAQAVETIPVKG